MFKNISNVLSFAVNHLNKINVNIVLSSKFSSIVPKWPEVIDELILPYDKGEIITPAHHNNPEVESLLKEKLCNFPPYKQRKYTHGFINAKIIRDWKKRIVSCHFEPLRTRLIALYKNTLMPRNIRSRAFSELNALPKDSRWTRVNVFCIMTGRRRGCKTRWGISRIIWRHFADYNKFSGVLIGKYNYKTEAERKYLIWPPPSHLTVSEYIKRYHDNFDDSEKDKSNHYVNKLNPVEC